MRVTTIHDDEREEIVTYVSKYILDLTSKSNQIKADKGQMSSWIT